MKTLKLAMIMTLVTCVIMLTMAFAVGAHAESVVLPSVVIECTETTEGWLVACIDKSGDVWGFYEDCEPWDIGDFALLTLYNDEVVEVMYICHLEGLDLILWLE